MQAIGRPLVSVIMINLNNGHALKKAIESVSAQDYDATEVVIVDAGSTDCSPGIIQQLGVLRHVRTFLHHDTSTPLPINKARQCGLNLATGDIVCFVDSDCVYPSDWISTIVEDMRLPNVAAVFGPRVPDMGSGLGTLVRRLEGHRSRKYRCREAVTFSRSSRSFFYVSGSNLAIRREVLVSLPLFDARFMQTSFEDVDLQMRITEAGGLVHFDPRLRIQHIHPLGARDLLRKSWRSGSGLAYLFGKYPRMALAKWSPAYDLFTWTLVPAVAACLPLEGYERLGAFLIMLWLDGLRRVYSRSLWHEPFWATMIAIPLKLIRDGLCLLSFCLTVSRAAVQTAAMRRGVSPRSTVVSDTAWPFADHISTRTQ